MADEIVLVTEKEYEKGRDLFAEAAGFDYQPAPSDEASLAEAVRKAHARAVVVGAERYSGPLYDALGEQEPALIARFGVGHDGIDKDLAREKGILVTNTPCALNQSVAELTFWLLGTLLRSLHTLDSAFREGTFAAPPAGTELRGKRLLVLGYGGIGRRVAAIGHFGFGMQVTAFGRRSLEELAEDAGLSSPRFQSEGGLEEYISQLNGHLGEADVVSIHLPCNKETRHFVDEAFIASMRPDAILINTARGPLVDECALYDALAGGRLSGAALDVFEREPYEPSDPAKDLRVLSNVVLSPHVGSNTREANERMAAACVANVFNFVQGELDELSMVYEDVLV